MLNGGVLSVNGWNVGWLCCLVFVMEISVNGLCFIYRRIVLVLGYEVIFLVFVCE